MTSAMSQARALFSILDENFQYPRRCGTVQFRSDRGESFFVTVRERSLAFDEGVSANPNATVTMSANLLGDISTPAVRSLFDSRVVEFSSRLTITGDGVLAHSLLDLVKMPTEAIIALLDLAKKKSAAQPVESVQSVYRPDLKFMLHRKAEFIPFVAAGVLGKWKVSSWSPESLKARFGHLKIASYIPGAIGDFVTAINSKADNRVEPPEGAEQRSGSYGRGTRTYTAGAGLPGFLWKEFPVPPILKEMGASGFPQLWMGHERSPRKPVTTTHCDTAHGFLCQIFGTKKFLLYSPDQCDLLYADRAYNYARPCHVSNPLEPDYTKHPLFRQARSIEITVNPGDVLFIPAGWFHCVFAPQPVMSISITCSEPG